MNGIAYIEQARAKQIQKGYTAEHDDQEGLDSIPCAAAILAMPCYLRSTDIMTWWPWTDYAAPLPELPAGMPTTAERIDELAKAGALCAAEIDRLMRREGIPVG